MDKPAILALVFSVLLLLLVAIFVLDAWGQYHGVSYKAPSDIVDMCHLAVQAAVGLLGYSAIRGGRKGAQNAKKSKRSGANPGPDDNDSGAGDSGGT